MLSSKAARYPREPILRLRQQILHWAERTDEQGGYPYNIVTSVGSPWMYAKSFIDYNADEAFGHFPRDGTATLFLLFVAATLEEGE